MIPPFWSRDEVVDLIEYHAAEQTPEVLADFDAEIPPADDGYYQSADVIVWLGYDRPEDEVEAEDDLGTEYEL